jgi:hypothetical protein
MNISQYVLDRRADPSLQDEKDLQRLTRASAKRYRKKHRGKDAEQSD